MAPLAVADMRPGNGLALDGTAKFFQWKPVATILLAIRAVVVTADTLATRNHVKLP